MQDVLIGKPESIQEVLVNATRALGATMEFHEARLQAELLLAHTLESTRAVVLARLDETISPDIAARYAANVARRAKHEPLAYVLGHQEFYGLDLIVDRRVLIPRHETEMLVALALEQVRHVPHIPPAIVEVGTGSGAVALALAHHLTNAEIAATDISPDALSVAEMNAKRLNLPGRVRFLQTDLLQAVTETFDILVANLPYIPSTRFAELPAEVRRFEPRLALDGGLDGLSVFRRLLEQLVPHARQGAVAFLEISEEQGEAALAVVRKQLPLAQVSLHRDLEELDRVIEIRLAEGQVLTPSMARRLPAPRQAKR